MEPEAPSPRYVHPGWPPGFWEEFDKLPPVSDAFVAAVYEDRPAEERQRVDRFLAAIGRILPFDADAARTYARVRYGKR